MAKLKSNNGLEKKTNLKSKVGQSIKKKKEVCSNKISKSCKPKLQMMKNSQSLMKTTACIKLEKHDKKIVNRNKQTQPIKIEKTELVADNMKKGAKSENKQIIKVKKVEKEEDYKLIKDDIVKILLQLEKEDENKKKSMNEKILKKGYEKKLEVPKNDKILKRKTNVNNSDSIGPKVIKKTKNLVKVTSKTIKEKQSNKANSMESEVVKKMTGKKRKHPKVTLNNENSEEIPKKQLKLNKDIYELVEFDEAQFYSIVKLDNVIKVVEGLKKVVESEVAKNKTQIFSDYKYMLQVTCFQIPCSPKRMVRLKLKHSIVGEDDSVLLIVKDLQRGSKVDYTPTTQHYEDVLKEHNIKGITVMPFSQFRKEYKPFEMRRKLSNSYDFFLCDSRVIRHASAICGKIFQMHLRNLHPIRLKNEMNLKSELNRALKNTSYKNFSKGNMRSIIVGTDKFTAKQVSENILTAVEYLKENFPGNLPNIRSLILKINIVGTTSLPIYLSTNKGPDETPYVVGPKEQRMNELKKSANEIFSKFHMTKEGKIKKLTKELIKNKNKIKKAKEALNSNTDNQETDYPNLAEKKNINGTAKVPKSKKSEKKAKKNSSIAKNGNHQLEDIEDESSKNVEEKSQDEDNREEETDQGASDIDYESFVENDDENDSGSEESD